VSKKRCEGLPPQSDCLPEAPCYPKSIVLSENWIQSPAHRQPTELKEWGAAVESIEVAEMDFDSMMSVSMLLVALLLLALSTLSSDAFDIRGSRISDAFAGGFHFVGYRGSTNTEPGAQRPGRVE